MGHLVIVQLPVIACMVSGYTSYDISGLGNSLKYILIAPVMT